MNSWWKDVEVRTKWNRQRPATMDYTWGLRNFLHNIAIFGHKDYFHAQAIDERYGANKLNGNWPRDLTLA